MVLASSALTQKLEDVFSAPLDALAGYVRRIDRMASGSHVQDVDMRPTSVEPGKKLEVETANAEPGPAWTCSSCNEENDAAFSHCWNCNTEKPSVP